MHEQIDIRRDEWGIPHMMAQTERGAIFGQGYCHAVDRLPSLWFGYRVALGRLAAVFGDDWRAWDELQADHRHATIAQAAYTQLDAETQALLQAYMAGIQHALDTHPELQADQRVEAWQLPRLEAWYPLALARAVTFMHLIGPAIAAAGIDPPDRGSPPLLSNLWATMPSRSSDGATYLCSDPHAAYGPDWLLHECALHGGDLSVYGFQHVGMPYIRFGHNHRVAWGFTSNAGRTARATHRPATEPQVRFMAQAWRRDWQLQTGYDGVLFDHIEPMRGLNKAQSVDDVLAVLAQQQLGPWHVIAADADGEIVYQSTGRIPRRHDAGQWGALYTPAELPTLRNPASGFLAQANGSARTVTLPPPFADLPDDLCVTTPTGFADENTPRGRRLLAVLGADTPLTLDAAKQLVMDNAAPEGVLWRDALLTLDIVPNHLRDALAAWDGMARSDDAALRWLEDLLAVCAEIDAAGLLALWESLLAGTPLDPAEVALLVDAIEETLNIGDSEPIILARGRHRYALTASEQLSMRVIGAVDEMPTRSNGQLAIAADYGSVAPLLVAFKDGAVQSWAVVPFGQTDFPTSSHYADQMPLFARGELRETFFAKKRQWSTIVIIEMT